MKEYTLVKGDRTHKLQQDETAQDEMCFHSEVNILRF